MGELNLGKVVPHVPKKVSELENDALYISRQSISEIDKSVMELNNFKEQMLTLFKTLPGDKPETEGEETAKVNVPTSPSGTLLKVIKLNNLYFACFNNNLLRSDNGTTWTTCLANACISNVLYVNGLYVAAGYLSNNINAAYLGVSGNGIAWTWKSLGSSGYGIKQFCYNSMTKSFFAVTNSKYVLESTDFSTWVYKGAIPLATQISAYSIGCGNGKIIIGATDGHYAHSDDGTIWTTANVGWVNSNMSAIVDIKAEGGVFEFSVRSISLTGAVTCFSARLLSSDLITWYMVF